MATQRTSVQQRTSLGRPIRVMVVDDSVVVRRVVTNVLSEDPAIDVVGSAANGSIALARITQINPDVISLDIEMPQMDGLETLRRIRATHPDIRVIMFSTLTERHANHTLEALSLGANDYVTKPSRIGSLDLAMAALREELIPKIKQFFSVTLEPPALSRFAIGAKVAAPRAPGARFRAALLAIGVSTGGPNALAEIFPLFPADFPCPIVVVQHMPPVFTRMLAERLSARSRLRVVEAVEGMPLEAGVALIAPGDYHLLVQKRENKLIAHLEKSPPQNSCRPAVDVLFSSLADSCGGNVLAVVLTGMGQDGYRGVQELKNRGAMVLAQDKATSVVWGMPGIVAEAGLADKVLALQAVVPEILKHVDMPHPAVARTP